jgi:hypothetical protein
VDVLEPFKSAVQSSGISWVRNNFPEGYVGTKARILSNLRQAFKEIARHTPGDDVVPMAEFLAKNRLFAGVTGGDARQTLRLLSELGQNCPDDRQLRFFSVLDGSSHLLPHLVAETQDRHLIAVFFERAMNAVGDDRLFPVLRHSSSWRSVPKDNFMAEHLIDRGVERLLPALQFGSVAGSKEPSEAAPLSNRREPSSGALTEHPLAKWLTLVASVLTILTEGVST